MTEWAIELTGFCEAEACSLEKRKWCPNYCSREGKAKRCSSGTWTVGLTTIFLLAGFTTLANSRKMVFMTNKHGKQMYYFRNHKNNNSQNESDFERDILVELASERGFQKFHNTRKRTYYICKLVDLTTLGQCKSSFRISFKSFTPASASESWRGNSSKGGTCIMNAKGCGNGTRNLIAGIWDQLARSDLILMFFVMICIPHSSVMMQMRQSANACILDDEDVAWVSRKMKSSEVDVINQIPKPEFMACLLNGKETREASPTEEHQQNSPKTRYQCMKCPISVGENFRTNSVLGRTESDQTGQKMRQTIPVDLQR